jgi:branched-chain amino acid transport system permease protein
MELVTILDIGIGGLLIGGIYALMAMGLSLQYGVARVLNVAHGEFIMIAGFLTFVLYTSFGISPLICLVIVGPIIFIVGFLLHKTMFRSLLKSSPTVSVFEGNSLLATFGLLYMIQNIAIVIWGSSSRHYTYMNKAIDVFGATFSLNRLVTLGFAIAIGVAFYLFLAYTRMGKAIRAASQDMPTAGLMGVNINNVLALCFGLGLLLAGLAGVLWSMCFAVYATMGLEKTIIAIVIVVLGGLGSIPGSFVGGIILGIIGSIVNYYEPSLTLAAYYFIFIILLMVRPRGIMGR